MHDIAEFLLCSPTDAVRSPVDSAGVWAPRAPLPFASSIARAAAGGFLADRVGYAFAAGYQEALVCLLAGTPFADYPSQPMALCATEDGGAHPRAILTTLSPQDPSDPDSPLYLDGQKRFVTLGDQARWLLIVAARGADSEGRRRLAGVVIESNRAGVTLAPAPPTPFVPEIPHASIRLDRVPIRPTDVLPGDGYDRYLKPFRTIEDAHVHAALLGHLIQIGRRFAWPRERLADALQLLCALLPIGSAPPLSAAVHVALAGVIAGTARFVKDCSTLWSQVDADIAGRWERDARLLHVASHARGLRLQSAWSSLGYAVESPPQTGKP